MNKKTIITGIQPTGRVHIGNYASVLSHLSRLQEGNNLFLFIADLHALTSDDIRDKNNHLEYLSREIILDYLSLGLDFEKVTIYRQSDILEISELYWILSNFINVSQLTMGHAYKSKEDDKQSVPASLLMYPVLMAADIFSIDADEVIVGQDQKQHLEIARDIARKINTTYETDVIKVPKENIINDELLRGVDGRKMSKSYNNTITLFSNEDEIKENVYRIVTGTKKKGEPLDTEDDILFSYHKIFNSENIKDIEKKYKNGDIGYKDSKDLLIDSMITKTNEMKKKREAYSSNVRLISDILTKGSNIVRMKADDVLKRVKNIMKITSIGF